MLERSNVDAIITNLFKEDLNAVLLLKKDIINRYKPCTETPEAADKVRKLDDKSSTVMTLPATFVQDPSGYVYEALESNRIEGVTATVYFSETENGDNPVVWDAEEYDQTNPLITDRAGRYAWDVPLGWWQVKYEKDGYETAYSDWLPVPPPQTEVNTGIVSKSAPKVLRVSGYEDYIEILFDKYMKSSTLIPSCFVLSGYADNYNISLVNEESGPDGSFYAKIVHLVPEGKKFDMTDSLSLLIDKSVESYAGVSLGADYQTDVAIKPEPKSIDCPSVIRLDYGETKDIVMAVTPSEAGAGKKITAASSAPLIATVTPETITGADAQAVISITGEMTGTAEILLKVQETQIVKTIAVVVSLPQQTPAETVKAAIPAANLQSGTVAEGTELILSSETAGAVIYYTTDNSSPCTDGTRQTYTGPLILTQDISIYAAAYKEGMEYSDVLKLDFMVVRVEPEHDPVFDGNAWHIPADNAYTALSLEGWTAERLFTDSDSESYLRLANGIVLVMPKAPVFSAIVRLVKLDTGAARYVGVEKAFSVTTGTFNASTWKIPVSEASMTMLDWTVENMWQDSGNRNTITAEPGSSTITVSAGTKPFDAIVKLKNEADQVKFIGVERR